MLTEQEIIDLFMDKVGETPEPIQIEAYKSYTKTELTAVLDRRIAAELDPTYSQRVAEDYMKYMYATPEEQSMWKFPEPIPQNK